MISMENIISPRKKNRNKAQRFGIWFNEKSRQKNEKKEDKKNVNKHVHNAAAIRPIRYREHVKERETKKNNRKLSAIGNDNS